MARKIEIPEIGKTFEFDDDVTDQEIDDIVNNEIMPSYQAVEKKPTSTGLEAFGLGAGQGVTFGLADEGKAFTGSLLDAWREGKFKPSWEEYQSLRDAYRKEAAQAEEEHPGAYLAGELTGMIPTVAGTGVGTGVVQSMKAGSALGAAHGLGSAREMEDIPMEVTKGAAIGGATAGLGNVIAGVATPVASRVTGEALEWGSKGLEPDAVSLLARKEALEAGKRAPKLRQEIVPRIFRAVEETAGPERAEQVINLPSILMKHAGNGFKAFGKFAEMLNKRAAQGGHSLSVAHFVLQQQDPEYRQFIKELEQKEKKAKE